MAWPLSFLQRFRRCRERGRQTQPRRRAVPLLRPGVEELEPRILLAGRLAHVAGLTAQSSPVHLVRHPNGAPAAPAGQTLLVPGLPRQTVRAEFTWAASNAVFHNEMGLFLVDDAQGGIGNLNPGERGYAAAALAPSRCRLIFPSGTTAGATQVVTLPAGHFFGLYLIQNGTSAAFRKFNAANRFTHRPVALFS